MSDQLSSFSLEFDCDDVACDVEFLVDARMDELPALVAQQIIAAGSLSEAQEFLAERLEQCDDEDLRAVLVSAERELSLHPGMCSCAQDDCDSMVEMANDLLSYFSSQYVLATGDFFDSQVMGLQGDEMTLSALFSNLGRWSGWSAFKLVFDADTGVLTAAFGADGGGWSELSCIVLTKTTKLAHEMLEADWCDMEDYTVGEIPPFPYGLIELFSDTSGLLELALVLRTRAYRRPGLDKSDTLDSSLELTAIQDVICGLVNSGFSELSPPEIEVAMCLAEDWTQSLEDLVTVSKRTLQPV
jgi:hypothetical protein